MWHAYGIRFRCTAKVNMAPKKPTRHTEVERKFDVVESTVTPSFEGLSAVTRVERSPSQHLEAVYFDTPGHDLAAHLVTLRRREWISIPALLRTTAEERDRQSRELNSLFYAESQALVGMLTFSPDYSGKLRVRRGTDGRRERG